MNDQDIQEQTTIDIQEDERLIHYLIDDYLSKITKEKQRILEHKKDLPPSSRDISIEQIEKVERALNSLHSRSINSYQEYLSIFESLKTYVSMFMGAISSLNSQSPSFFSSWHSLAGRHTGIIKQAINDYYRDQHTDERMYEQKFKKEYIDVPIKFPFHVYATSSGMAALTTICGYILGEIDEIRPVLLGKHCYFEERHVVRMLFSKRVIEIDERHIPELASLVKHHQPAAIFLDTLSNSANIIQPPIEIVINTISKNIKHRCIIVIDNTCLSIACQLFQHHILPHRYARVIVWESLLKHHQFGLDKTNGGIIYTNDPDGYKLYTYRDHLGTNIADTQTLLLPTPNLTLLLQRLLRHERNARILVEKLMNRIQSSMTVKDIISPLSPTHPDHGTTQHFPFHGAFLTMSFHPRYANVSWYKRVLAKAFRLAKQSGVPLVGGTSFGFPITRLYIPASRPGQGTSFFRISVGTEPVADFLRVIDILEQIFQ